MNIFVVENNVVKRLSVKRYTIKCLLTSFLSAKCPIDDKCVSKKSRIKKKIPLPWRLDSLKPLWRRGVVKGAPLGRHRSSKPHSLCKQSSTSRILLAHSFSAEYQTTQSSSE